MNTKENVCQRTFSIVIYLWAYGITIVTPYTANYIKKMPQKLSSITNKGAYSFLFDCHKAFYGNVMVYCDELV